MSVPRTNWKFWRLVDTPASPAGAVEGHDPATELSVGALGISEPPGHIGVTKRHKLGLGDIGHDSKAFSRIVHKEAVQRFAGQVALRAPGHSWLPAVAKIVCCTATDVAVREAIY